MNELKRAFYVFGILLIYWIIATAFLYRDDIAYACHHRFILRLVEFNLGLKAIRECVELWSLLMDTLTRLLNRNNMNKHELCAERKFENKNEEALLLVSMVRDLAYESATTL